MAGLAGFMLIFIMSFSLLSTMYQKIPESMDKKTMEITSYYAFEQLLSPGDPANWYSVPVFNNFGLEKEAGVLDESKIIAFNLSVAANYSFVKERLGIPAYNFSIEIFDFYNRSTLYSMGTEYTNSSGVLSAQRISTLNNSLVLVQLRVAK